MGIHKAQGQNIEDVVVDLGSGAFCPGQVYVAFSRVKSIQGLKLARPLREEDVRVSSEILEFYDSLDRLIQQTKPQ